MPKINKLGVIGSPIDHSLSPFIHSRFARQANLNIDYRPYKVEPDEIGIFLKDFFADRNAIGLNVTLPLKKEAFTICDSKSEEVCFIEASNTLIKKNRSLHGETTDSSGFISDLKDKNIELFGKKVLLIGAGDATKSILWGITKQKPKQLFIINRTIEKAERLAEKYGEFADIHVVTEENNINADIIINTSSAGVTGEFREPYITDLNDSTIVYDLNYSINETPFCKWARSFTEKNFDGTGMLVHQAAKSFKLWFNYEPDVLNVLNEIERFRNE